MSAEAGRDGLVGRLRDLLAAEHSTREVSMFGGRAFMVNEKMLVCALKGGHLLVRVDAARHDELVARPGAAQAEMGAGRTMGPGWIQVDAGSIDDDAGLGFWLGVALEHNEAATADQRPS